jgi:adenylate cyclase
MSDAFEAMRRSLQSFERYVPSSLVKALIREGKIAQVDGENKELTFLFSDISNFTQLAEHIDPYRLMQILSEYFESMTQAVIQANGTVDKYIGDAVMAFWNAPLLVPEHALRACQTAVDMLQRMKILNQHWYQQGLPNLSIRIGINTGFAIVGNVGSQERLSYTAIGDNVNLASRLEALNKIYGTQIIVAQTTYELVKNHFTFRFIDNVAVRGKKKGVAIYELVTETPTDILMAYQQQFMSAFVIYQQGDWQQSLKLFEELVNAYPDDKIAQLFIKRCNWLIETNPVQWDGIWRME